MHAWEEWYGPLEEGFTYIFRWRLLSFAEAVLMQPGLTRRVDDTPKSEVTLVTIG